MNYGDILTQLKEKCLKEKYEKASEQSKVVLSAVEKDLEENFNNGTLHKVASGDRSTSFSLVLNLSSAVMAEMMMNQFSTLGFPNMFEYKGLKYQIIDFNQDNEPLVSNNIVAYVRYVVNL